ncbi:MAG: c-type cytochrome [Nitrospinota bacterium]
MKRNAGRRLTSLVLFVCLVMAAPRSFAGQEGDPKAGKKTYGVLCASCHGNSGKGDGPAAATLPTKPADHTDGKRMHALSDQFLFDIIKGGGASLGKSPLMPPWGAQLKDQEIRNVVAYIRTLAKTGK